MQTAMRPHGHAASLFARYFAVFELQIDILENVLAILALEAANRKVPASHILKEIRKLRPKFGYFVRESLGLFDTCAGPTPTPPTVNSSD